MEGELRPGMLSGWEREMGEGWWAYRRAVEQLGRDEQQLALRLLAEAEIAFRSSEDQHGLWHALAGQTAVHWQQGDAALALARAGAALRAAVAAGDRHGVSVVAWQLAVLQLCHEEYRDAAASLLQLEEALSHQFGDTTGGNIAACVQLCGEVDRWQEMYARRLVTRRTAVQVVGAVQRDLADRLGQVVVALRVAWRQADGFDAIERLLLVPNAPREPLARLAVDQPSLWTRLRGWWQALGVRSPALQPPAGRPAALEPSRQPVALVEAQEGPQELPVDAAQGEPLPSSAPRPAGSARVAVHCFGRFRVALDDQLIDRWESVRGRTIFKYLITRRGAVAPKEQLADMFWPESEPELARRSLHQAIYCLRQSFKRVDPGLAIVLFNGDCYQINPDISIWVDSEEFSAAMARARAAVAAGQSVEAMRAYSTAADLADGEFLEEDRYEPWADELRHNYRAMAAEALRQLAGYHYERGDYAAAIVFGQRLLAQDSCDEEAHITLMRCYAAQGLRHLAVRQYQICVTTLKVELDLSPSDELEAAYRQLSALA